MYTKIVKYKNFNGETKEKELSFHLTPPDVAKLDAKFEKYGGFEGVLEMVHSGEQPEVSVMFFEELINLSYGEKSPDGETFNRTNIGLFIESAAYDQFFMELLSVKSMAADFFNGVIPEIPEELSDNIKANIVDIAT